MALGGFGIDNDECGILTMLGMPLLLGEEGGILLRGIQRVMTIPLLIAEGGLLVQSVSPPPRATPTPIAGEVTR